MGEEIVIEIEKRRLIALGREDLVPNIAHVAKVKDGLGYDIVSIRLYPSITAVRHRHLA